MNNTFNCHTTFKLSCKGFFWCLSINDFYGYVVPWLLVRSHLQTWERACYKVMVTSYTTISDLCKRIQWQDSKKIVVLPWIPPVFVRVVFLHVFISTLFLYFYHVQPYLKWSYEGTSFALVHYPHHWSACMVYSQNLQCFPLVMNGKVHLL